MTSKASKSLVSAYCIYCALKIEIPLPNINRVNMHLILLEAHASYIHIISTEHTILRTYFLLEVIFLSLLDKSIFMFRWSGINGAVTFNGPTADR